MSIITAMSGDRNVNKKEAEDILKYKNLPVAVQCVCVCVEGNTTEGRYCTYSVTPGSVRATTVVVEVL